MSTTLSNGEEGWVITLDGSVEQFLRKEGMSAEDITLLDSGETAAASASGSQTVDMGGGIAGGDSSGLANDSTAYTATVTVDGVDNSVSIVGSASQTYTTVINEINADLSGATAAITGGNIVITSDSSDDDSKIVIADTDLFSSLTDYVAINDPVDGDLKTDLMSRAHHTNVSKYAWDVFATAVETYDPSSDKVLFNTDLTEITGGQSPTEAEHNTLLNQVQAIKNILDDHKNV